MAVGDTRRTDRTQSEEKFGRTAKGQPRPISARERNKIAGATAKPLVIGTLFDQNQRLFNSYEDGMVFEYDYADPRQISTMLEKDGKARAIEQALTLPIRAAEFSIEQPRDIETWRHKPDAPDGDQVDQAVMNLVRENLSPKMPLLIAQMTSAIAHRKAFFEKIWKFENGRVLYDQIAYRPPETCDQAFDSKTGHRLGFRQRLAGTPVLTSNFMNMKDWSAKRASRLRTHGYVLVPHPKSFVYVHGSHREPIKGLSDLDVSYWAYETRQKIMFLWFQFLENQALPRTIVYGNTQGEANNLADAVAGLRSSGVLGLQFPNDPDRKLFDTLESSGAGASQFIEAINYLESQMSQSVLTGFMDLTTQNSAKGGTGSYALSADQSEFFLSSRQAVADEIAEAITRDVIAPLVHFNFGDVPVPKVQIGPLSRAETERSMTLLNSIVTAPTLNIPRDFVDMLVTHVSTFLGLDENKVETQMTEDKALREKQAEENKRMQEQIAKQGPAQFGPQQQAGAQQPPRAAGQRTPAVRPQTNSAPKPSTPPQTGRPPTRKPVVTR